MGVENVESLLLGIQVNGRGIFSTQGGTYLLYFPLQGAVGGSMLSRASSPRLSRALRQRSLGEAIWTDPRWEAAVGTGPQECP